MYLQPFISTLRLQHAVASWCSLPSAVWSLRHRTGALTSAATLSLICKVWTHPFASHYEKVLLWGLMSSRRPLQPIRLRKALNSFVTGLNLICSTHCICPGNEADQSFSVLLFQSGLLPHLSNGNILDPPTIKKRKLLLQLCYMLTYPLVHTVLNKKVQFTSWTKQWNIPCFTVSSSAW